MLRPDSNRVTNKLKILQYIRSRDQITKPDIQRDLNLSAPTVSHLVDELVEERFVRWNGVGASTDQGGKKPNLYSFNGTAALVVALHVGAQHLDAALLDMESKVVFRQKKNIKQLNQEQLVDSVLSVVQRMVDKARQQKIPAIGIGIGWSGVVSFHEGTILESVHFNLKEHLPLGPLLKERFGLPVWIDHEANNLVLAEKWFGFGELFDSMSVIAIDEGIGSGVIINNRLVRGEDNSFGEVGHMTVNMDGQTCRCGRQGCWELYASTGALLQLAGEALGEPADTLSVGTLAQRAQDGDDIARRVVYEAYVTYVSAGLANLVNIFNPNVIVLHGDISMFGESWLENVTARVKRLALPTSSSRVSIRYSSFGEQAHLVGAGALCIKELFEQPDALFAAGRQLAGGLV